MKIQDFRKIDPPEFIGGKSEGTHQYLTTCRELLDNVELGKSNRVHYDALQYCGPRKRWYIVYFGSLVVGSLLVTCEVFARAFYNCLVSLIIREESSLSFKSQTPNSLIVPQYETHFIKLLRHVLFIIPDEIEIIHRFVKGFSFSF